MLEKCQRCSGMGEDRRTLEMRCSANMGELGLPFAKAYFPPPTKPVYMLRVCKQCRADWLQAIKDWFAIECTPEKSFEQRIPLQPPECNDAERTWIAQGPSAISQAKPLVRFARNETDAGQIPRAPNCDCRIPNTVESSVTVVDVYNDWSGLQDDWS